MRISGIRDGPVRSPRWRWASASPAAVFALPTDGSPVVGDRPERPDGLRGHAAGSRPPLQPGLLRDHPRQPRRRRVDPGRRQDSRAAGPAHPAARPARGHRRQPARAPPLLLPQAQGPRRAGGHHLPGEHRQDGLAHAARGDARHRQDQDTRRGIRPSRCARNTRRTRTRCRRSCRRGRTTRSATSPCAWPPAAART